MHGNFHGVGPVLNPTDRDYEAAAHACARQASVSPPHQREQWFNLHHRYAECLRRRQWMPSRLREMTETANAV